MTTETVTADQLLLEDAATAPRVLICSIYEDQRPLKGTAGALDWRLRGFLSRFVKSGRIGGKQGEIVYIPFQHHGSVRHLLLVGLGAQQDSSDEAKLLSKISETVEQLKFERVAISRSSFPFINEAKMRKAFGSINVEFTQ